MHRHSLIIGPRRDRKKVQEIHGLRPESAAAVTVDNLGWEDAVRSHLVNFSVPAEAEQQFGLVHFEIVSITRILLDQPVNNSDRGDADTLTSDLKQLVKVREPSVDVPADDCSRILIIDDQIISHRRIEVSHKF
jgi:hypothetical protein